MCKYLSGKQEQGQGLVEYALVLVLVAVVVIAILTVLGPQVGNVFSRVNDGLASTSGGGSAAAAPTAVPTAATVTFNCSASGSVDVKNMSGGPNGASFSCTPNASYTYTVSGQSSGTHLQFRNMYSPYTVLADYTVP